MGKCIAYSLCYRRPFGTFTSKCLDSNQSKFLPSATLLWLYSSVRFLPLSSPCLSRAAFACPVNNIGCLSSRKIEDGNLPAAVESDAMEELASQSSSSFRYLCRGLWFFALLVQFRIIIARWSLFLGRCCTYCLFKWIWSIDWIAFSMIHSNYLHWFIQYWLRIRLWISILSLLMHGLVFNFLKDELETIINFMKFNEDSNLWRWGNFCFFFCGMADFASDCNNADANSCKDTSWYTYSPCPTVSYHQLLLLSYALFI